MFTLYKVVLKPLTHKGMYPKKNHFQTCLIHVHRLIQVWLGRMWRPAHTTIRTWHALRAQLVQWVTNGNVMEGRVALHRVWRWRLQTSVVVLFLSFDSTWRLRRIAQFGLAFKISWLVKGSVVGWVVGIHGLCITDLIRLIVLQA